MNARADQTLAEATGVDRMFDLAITPLPDGGFQLSQQGSRIDEPDIVELHPVQIRWLAERAGLLTPDPTPRMSPRHVERLRALHDRVGEIYRFYLDEILERCGYGVEFSLHLRAIDDLTDEMLADFGTAPADAGATDAVLPGAVVAECHEKSAVISVTSKRGRPKKENKLTDAERQARHRAKQAEGRSRMC